MKNIELKSNENIVDYIIAHSEEVKDAKIMLQNVDLSKYGLIESTNYEVIRPKKKLIDNFRKATEKSETHIITYEYFLKGRKDVSMLVKETSSIGPWLPKTRELLKVFKNHNYTKTLFVADENVPEKSIYLVKSNARKSAFLTDGIFVLSKNDCVSNFIVENMDRFEGKSIIITDNELKNKYLGWPKKEGEPFSVTPVDYKFKGQQNVIRMELLPIAGAPGNYYVNNIVKRIHTATPVYDVANTSNDNIITISETRKMVK